MRTPAECCQLSAAKCGDLALIFVEVVAEEVVHAVYDDEVRIDVRGSARPCTLGISNLSFETARDQRDAVTFIEEVLEVAEAVVLLGVVVERCRAAVRGLDAEIVLDVIAGHEVGVRP